MGNNGHVRLDCLESGVAYSPRKAIIDSANSQPDLHGIATRSRMATKPMRSNECRQKVRSLPGDEPFNDGVAVRDFSPQTPM
jgi:hypothetical protein